MQQRLDDDRDIFRERMRQNDIQFSRQDSLNILNVIIIMATS